MGIVLRQVLASTGKEQDQERATDCTDFREGTKIKGHPQITQITRMKKLEPIATDYTDVTDECVVESRAQTRDSGRTVAILCILGCGGL